MNIFQKLHGLFKGHGGYILMIFVVSVLGYGAFLRYAPIYDFNNFFFPYRYSVVDTIHQHSLPFWNPYQAMGIPAHADPQSGVFYLPVWLFALLFGKYTTWCCGAEFILHAFVGGVGCYLLAYRFCGDRLSAFVVGCCYLLSGFFVGNGQHLVWIISAAWLPWVVRSFILLFEEPGGRAMLLFPVVFSLMLSGGYPGFIFVTFYLLLFIAVFQLIVIWRNDRARLKSVVAYGGGALLLCLLMCAPVLYSFWEIKSEMTRGAGLAFESTDCPLTLPCLSSLLFPYPANSDSAFTHTDISMGSLFMGLLTLPMVAAGLWHNRNRLLWLLIAFGTTCLLLAFGTGIPSNRLLFNHIPFLNLIRLPALYRLFFILPMLLVAAVGMRHILADWDANRRKLFIATGAMGMLTLVAAAVMAVNGTFISDRGWLEGTLGQKFAVEALIAGIFLCTFAACCQLKNSRNRTIILVALMLLEPIGQAHICGPKTVYDKKMDLTQLERATSVEGFPIPDSLKSSEKIIQLRGLTSLWTNVGMFVKEVEYYSISPVKLYRNMQMLRPYRETETPLYLPLAFLPKCVVADTAAHFLNADTAYASNSRISGDYPSDGATAEVVCFRPGRVIVRTHTEVCQPLVLCQNVYPGWKASIDGRSTRMDTLNWAMQTVMLPAGDHEVTLCYRRPLLNVLFLLQILLTLGSLCGLIVWRFCKRKC